MMHMAIEKITSLNELQSVTPNCFEEELHATELLQLHLAIVG